MLRSRFWLITVLFLGAPAMATETPKHTVVGTIDGIEIREYPAIIVAETRVEGPLTEAGNLAFRKLAGYIFGGNRTRTKIAMTAPVTQTAEDSGRKAEPGEKIAMTAPVTQTQADKKDAWLVQFTMPSSKTMENLPEPVDSSVTLRELPPRRVAVVRYSGTWSESNYKENLEKLRSTLRQQNIEPQGEPVWARYDAPYVPWFLRHNEIQLAVPSPEAPAAEAP